MPSPQPVDDAQPEPNAEVPVPQLLRCARPLPAHEDMLIDDLTEEEGAAFLAAVNS